MILTGDKIHKEWEKGNIIINPFNTNNLKPNSYDITLSRGLIIYCKEFMPNSILDCKELPTDFISKLMPNEGFILYPNQIYLGTTNEKVGSYKYVPFIEGKSSLGRLGLSIHQTAGRGDLGFIGHWTLELSVLQPLRIYPDMPIGQFVFFKTKGHRNTELYYDKLTTSKYKGTQKFAEISKMYKNFLEKDTKTLDIDTDK